MTAPSPRDAAATAGLRDDLAVWLLAIDECVGGDRPADYLDHERSFLARNRGGIHSGDCTKESHSCARCICDQYLDAADALLAGPLAPILAALSAAEAERDDLRLRVALSDRPVYSRRKLIAERDALASELGRTYGELMTARVALQPFAQAASGWDADENDGHEFHDSENVAAGEGDLTVGHLRAARAALNDGDSDVQG